MTSVIFMGTPEFSVPILDGLLEQGYDILAVVTQPDKKTGRKQLLTKTPVKLAAQRSGLRVFQPKKLAQSSELIDLIELKADLIITAAYGQFLPVRLLKSVKIAAVNVHGSLLPKYRGGAPIQYALLNGEKKTGITIMEMVKKMDAGDIFAQSSIEIASDDSAGTLFEKLSQVGCALLLKTLPKIIDGSVIRTKQNAAEVTFAPNIAKSQERLDKKMTAQKANNVIRALNPDPGAYLMLQGQRLKIWKAEVAEDHTSLAAGCLVSNKKRFALSFADATILNLLEVQPVGKRRMSVQAFLNGRSSHYPLGEEIVDD